MNLGKAKDNKKFKKKFAAFIIGFLIISFIYNHNFFRKFYNIFQKGYETRLIEKYGYCSGESIGFLRMLKKKYKFNFNPTILNYHVLPSSAWSIYDTYNQINTKHKIFLNYPEKFYLMFEPLNKKFSSKGEVQHSNGISSISFNLKDQQIKINSNIKIYKKKYNEEEDIIYEKNFNKLVINNQKIPLQLKTEKINSRRGPILIEMSDLSDDEIMNIKGIILDLDHEFELKNFKIMEQFNNCYYVK